MPSCVLRSCKNNIKKLKKTHGITYHQFPSSGLRRQEWVDIIRKERNQHDWSPTKHTRICSAHFKDEDKYIASGDRVYITKTAVPVINEQSDQNNVQFTVPFTLNVINNVKSENVSSTILDFSSKLELQGRIQQLLIQKMVLTEKCKTWKQKYIRLQRRLAIVKQSAANNISIIDAGNIRRSNLKWIESEVLGI